MRKWFALALVLSLFAVIVLGCSSKKTADPALTNSPKQTDTPKQTEQPKGEKQKLTFWMKKQLVEDQNKLIEERVKQFGAENNADVNVEFIAYENFFPKWTAAIESGNTPDVSFFGYQEVGQFFAKDVLLDVSDVIKRIEQKNGDIYPSMKKAVTFNDKQYAIPYWSEASVLYYRKDILQKAGFNAPPKTWDEFRAIAKKVTDPAKGVYGAGIGYGKGNSDAEWLTRSIIWSFGGSLVDKTGKTPAVNSPETIQAAKFISDLFLIDKTTPASAVGWDDSGNNKAYISGQAAMIVNTGSVLNAIKKDNPELYQNTGIAPIPSGPKGTFIPGISNNLGIFKNTKNKELAAKFVEYMTSADWYKSWIEKGAPLTGPIFNKLENEPVWQEANNKAFVESTKSFTFLGYPGEYTPKAGEVYNLRYINDAFQRIMVDKFTPEKAVQELQTKLEELYKK